MVRINTLLAAIFLLGLSSVACAQSGDSLARGRLLYGTYCISCHAAEIHWREKKLASDWSALKNQVRRWQKVAELGWSEDDIEQVSAYLNASYYHFSATDKIGLGPQKPVFPQKQEAKEQQ
jgi:mono/diheme cytochrome c family protein